MGFGQIAALVLAIGFIADADAHTNEWSRVRCEHSLKEMLLGMAAERLAPLGWFLDTDRAWLSLSKEMRCDGDVLVRPLWSDAAHAQLPLRFDLRTDDEMSHASLAAPLLREYLVAARRLRKGSSATCADFRLERLPVRTMSDSLTGPCVIAADAIVFRDMVAGDVPRRADIGQAPDVMAGMPVRVEVVSGQVAISTIAVALHSALVGEPLAVRLTRPVRVLRTRVTGPAAAQVLESQP